MRTLTPTAGRGDSGRDAAGWSPGVTAPAQSSRLKAAHGRFKRRGQKHGVIDADDHDRGNRSQITKSSSRVGVWGRD